MNNCEKKLDALIEALGFDVEKGEVTAGDLITRMYSSSNYSTKEIKELYPNKHIVTECFGGKWVVSEPVTDYKVTKCNKKDYDYMKKIRSLAVESKIPKSVLIDLIGGIYE